MDKKDFDGWIKLKEKIHNDGKPRPIREGDVWWYAAGENVKTEINGKSNRFSRPVVIVKKFGRLSFWGIPLTTKIHDCDWYVSFEFQGKVECAALIQMRNIDTARLYDRIGQLPNSDLLAIKRGLFNLLFKSSK